MLLIRRAVVYYTPCATVNLIQEAGSHTKTLITLLAFSQCLIYGVAVLLILVLPMHFSWFLR